MFHCSVLDSKKKKKKNKKKTSRVCVERMMHGEPLSTESGSLSPFALFRHLSNSQRFLQNVPPVSDQELRYQQQQSLLLPTTESNRTTTLPCEVSRALLNPQFHARASLDSSGTSNNEFSFSGVPAAVAATEKWKWLEPIPQSGFKGVSWNSRMKAWLAFYVTENGERKSKTFSTKKLGMEEARLQAITFCKQKQEQRKEAHKRNRVLKRNPLSTLTFIEQLSAAAQNKRHSQDMLAASNLCASTQQLCSTSFSQEKSNNSSNRSTNASDDQIAYIPIVPISLDMIQETGLLQPLELTVLPPCQHCSRQPYPFLMIVSDENEQSLVKNPNQLTMSTDKSSHL